MKTKTLAGALAAALATLTLAACGSSDEASSDGPWTYTDDIGTEIELDALPERIVAQSSVAAALTDLGLGDKIVGVFGPLENPDGDPDPQAAGLDVESVEDVTGAGEYGDVDVEAVAALDPDLIVTSSYLEPDLWYVNEASKEQLDKQYQTLVISFDGKTLTEIFDSTERAAQALGADESDFADGREAFTAASERIQGIAEAEDPTILATSPSPDVLYVSNPDVSPDLKYYRDELGLNITTPDNPDEGGYFETLSWENADKYEGEVIMWDDRVGQTGFSIYADQPVFGTVEGVENDAFVPWTSVFPPTAQAVADVMDTFADNLEGVLG